MLRLPLLTLIALLSCASLGWAQSAPAGLASDDGCRCDEPTEAVRVMTFNIRYNNPRDGVNAWPNRKQFVADIVTQNQVDIVGMQEVKRDQLDDLRTRLSDYDWYGVGRDDGKSGGEFSPIFYRRDRWRLLEKKTFWLSETPEVVASKNWDAAITRIVTQVKLEDRRGGHSIHVFNTHFDHRGSIARAKSAELIVKRLPEDDDARLIVMGDFNCLPNSKPFNTLTSESSGLRDSRALSQSKPSGPNSTWSGFRRVEPNRRIDFIFVRGPWQVQRHETIDKQRDGRFPSDHLPVLTVLQP